MHAVARASRRQRRPRRVRAPDGGRLPEGSSRDDYLDALAANPQNVATRKSSELALEAINAFLPETIGGSADLTGSNNTKTKAQKPLTKEDYSGRYIYYGIREFGMARGDERHGAARRRHPLWRHLPDLLRLLPAGDPPVGAAADPGRSM